MVRVGARAGVRMGAIVAALAWVLPMTAMAAPLIADLSKHRIGISTGFTGTDVLLFGATEGPGDIVVVVRGPNFGAIVRRKTRVAGVWVNGAQIRYPDAPAFYAVASSRPIDTVMNERVRAQNQVGTDMIQLSPDRTFGDSREMAAFRAALVRNEKRRGLFQTGVGKVRFLGNRLFRAEIAFPANVPTGIYTVEVFLVRKGSVVSAQTTPLVVSRAGFGAEVFRFAHTFSVWYGLIAIALALTVGWFASVILRRF